MAKGRPSPRLAVGYCVHDDFWFLQESLNSAQSLGQALVFVSKVPWHGEPGDWQKVVEVAEESGATVVLGEWPDESNQRGHALAFAAEKGHTHLVVLDGDEVLDVALVQTLIDVAKADLADVVEAQMDTYWSSPEYLIRPREALCPVVMVKLGSAEHVHIRNYVGHRRLRLSDGHGLLHHLSYCGPDARIERKLETWSHRDEVVPGWWSEKWLGWKQNRRLRDLHPTHPQCYGFTERIIVPSVLSSVPTPSSAVALEKPLAWPTISVCIPLCGGEEDIRVCLDSLANCSDLLHEIIVVDNFSPDGAREIARTFNGVSLIENESNRGFAVASNQAFQASSGEVVLFLNSDTFVPRTGLIRLITDLMQTGSVAAAGPVSNNSGHFQQIDVTYTSLATIELFAQDLASSTTECRDTDMLVGFCLAVKRAPLMEAGSFDEAFGLGLFEDNDLCHRLRRAGYRLVISDGAFVHHRGSGTFDRLAVNGYELLKRNEQIYRAKWQVDLETGFASQLSGLSAERIQFDEEKRPERIVARCKSRAEHCDISLCMIVKDEERVLGDCLKSAVPYFKELIIVDTGSTDSTPDIARQHGAKVYCHPWQKSFAEARNRSLDHASGKWIFWLDADDTLPIASGLAIQQAVMEATPDVKGFVVPVQFVNDGANAGTRVDHVKLFRNLPAVRFEGRIHEQILPQLRQLGGNISRLDALVLHSGYDTSPLGQLRKRARDRELLTLDFFERKDHPFVSFNLGMTAHFNQQHRKAVRWLRRSIELAGSSESHLRKAYALLAVSLRELGNDSEALWTLSDGLKTQGEDPELHFQSAMLHTKLGNLQEAVRHYSLVLGCDASSTFNSFDIGILGFKTHHNLASVLVALGRTDEAVGHFRAAMSGSSDFTASAEELFELALNARDWPTAQDCVDHVNRSNGLDRLYCSMAGRLAEATEGIGGRINLFTYLAATRPGLAQPRIELARALLDARQIPRAIAILRELESSGCAEAAYYLGINRLISGDAEEARKYMLRAWSLNPGHETTAEQIRHINRELGLDEESGLV